MIDLRNVYEPGRDAAPSAGRYAGVGRPDDGRNASDASSRHRRRRLPRAATSATACSPRATRSSRWTTSSPATRATSRTSPAEKRFRFVHHDVTEYIFVDGPVDAVLHFASPGLADRLPRAADPDAQGRLARHAQRARARARRRRRRFLLASTSEVYGDPLVHPQPETYWGNVNPIGPRGVYDEAKRFAEAMTMAYHRSHGVDTRIVRIFNTYGPRMRPRDGRVVPAFIGQALARRAADGLRRRLADPLASATSPTSSTGSTGCCSRTSTSPSTSATPPR